MRRHTLLALPAVAAFLLPAASGSGSETRAASPQEFSELLGAADQAFARQDYLNAVETLHEGILIANAVLRDALLGAMPLAPDGFVEIQAPEMRVMPSDPLGGAMALSKGRPIEQLYRKKEGIGEIRVLVAPNSPAVTAVRRAIALAETDPKSEVVECGRYAGVLARRRTSFVLRFVLGGAHMIEVRAHGTSEENVLTRVDEAFLTRVARALGG